MAVPSSHTDSLLAKLQKERFVIAFSVDRGASVTAERAGCGELVFLAARRMSMDMSRIVVLGLAVFWLKQKLRHSEAPLV